MSKDKDTVGKRVLTSLENERLDTSLVIDQSFFSLPTEEDFYGDSVPINFLKDIDGKKDGKGNPYDALFYKEEPYSTNLGYHKDANVFVIGFDDIKKAVTEDGVADADTVYFNFDNIDDGNGNNGNGFEIEGKHYNNFKEYVKANTEGTAYKKLGLRFIGINSPEIPHYVNAKSPEEYKNDKKFKTKEMTFAEINKSSDGIVYDKTINHKKDDKMFFVKVAKDGDNKWHEIRTVNKSSKMVFIDESDGANTEKTKQALKAKKTVEDLLSSAEDIRVVVDAKVINKSSSKPGYNFDNSFDIISSLKAILDPDSIPSYLTGWNAPGQEYNKRFLGCIYIKKSIPVEDGSVKSVWINLNKYLISKYDAIETNPNYWNDPLTGETNNFAADAFKLWTYNGYKNSKIIDAMENMSSKDLDNRNEIQKEITGLDLEQLKEFTVMIGDCLFLVPPTSIRCTTQTNSTRIPLLRSRGAMTKGAQKSLRQLELTLYFNEDGINGIPYKTKLPNGEDITYYMNGLRALISQFKFTPFLPIENNFINKVLNIEAVSLVNIQISTMPDYPRCVAASLVLEEFNYRIYMPEIPVPDPETEDLNKNLFASTINFEVLRWYYQRPIIKGEDLKSYPFDSKEYIEATFGSRTVLQSVDTLSSNVDFYLIDKEYLDKQLQLKLNSMNAPLKDIVPLSDKQKSFASNLGNFIMDINDSLASDTCQKLLDNINSNKDGMRLKSVYNDSKMKEGKVSTDSDQDLKDTCIYKGNKDDVNAINSKDFLTKYANPFINQFCQSLKGSKNLDVTNCRTSEFVDGQKVFWFIDVGFNLRPEYGLSKGYDDVNKIIKNITANNPNINLTDALVDNKIRIGFSINFGSKNPKLELCKDLAGYKLLLACNGNNDNVATGSVEDESKEFDEINKDYYSQSDEMLKRKQSVDTEQPESLKFIKYQIENIKIKNLACIFGNNFTKMNLEAFDGFAPQFTGGQDTIIEINIQTQDDNAVLLLNQLPKVSAEYVRDYRLVLNCWPLRIDSEITRLLGVNEVMVESVDVTTVPGQPGLYAISMRMISVDRTVRNREALKKIDGINNSGLKSPEAKNNIETKNYFDLKKVLGQAEIYPDLELPTIDELAQAGFKFLRYSNTKSYRVFPDPDFYFCYSYILGYQIFRDGILKFFNENNNKDNSSNVSLDLFDKTGSGATLKPNGEKTVYTVTDSNENYKKLAEKNKQLNESIQQIKTDIYKNAKDNSPIGKTYGDIINDLAATDIFGGWDVGKEIKTVFREKKYEASTTNKNKSECAKQLQEQANNAIKVIDEILSKPLEEAKKFSPQDDGTFKEWSESHYKSRNLKGQQSQILSEVDDVSKLFSCNDSYEKILDALCVPRGSSFDSKIMKGISNMLYSATSARTGLKECGEDKDESDWQPRMFVMTENTNHSNEDSKKRAIPICEVEDTKQGKAGNYQALDVDDAIKNGIRFGMFGIKKYPRERIISMLNITPTLNKNSYFIDPYYMNMKEDEYEMMAYKQAIMISPKAAATAFLRNVLVWIKKMLQDNLLLSLYDLIQFEVMDDIEESYRINTVRSQYNVYEAGREKGHQVSKYNVYEAGRTKKEEDSPVNVYEAGRKKKQEKSKYNVYEAGSAEKAAKENLQEKAKKKAEDKNATDEDKDKKTTKKEIDPNQLKAEAEKFKEKEMQYRDLMNDIKKTMEENKAPLALGKFFPAFVMAVTDGDMSLYSKMKERNYDELNAMVISILSPDTQNNGTPTSSILLRRFLLGLYGAGLIDKITEFAESNNNISDILKRTIGEKVVIDRADKPMEYLRDSFLDMIQNDKRGRMCRAFPTYYMFFIDEGREIGYWKLHDNFYNMSAIGEIQVTKSRKIAADTAKISMTNLFGSYTEQDTDQKELINYGIHDAWNSIFSPRTYYLKEELRRTNSAPVNQARMVPGVRLSLRMGYGADASTLPTIFNGSVAEVSTGEVVEIIAQGDGIETMNQIMTDADAEHFEFEGHEPITGALKEAVTMGITPRELICAILTSKGGFLKKMIRKMTNGRLYNENPYGLIHLGDQDYKKIFKSGEVVQNIYEALPCPSWGEDSQLTGEYKTDGAPRISFHALGKSFYDILNICLSVQPDFVMGITPFGLRSTLFFGAPRYYYAYDYINEVSEHGESQIKEKRKPFQQYHYYTSFSDIVSNSIVTSERDVRTCAVGLYTERGWLGRDKPKSLDPMFVDFDIYPEKQKTMYYDTQYLAKGSVLGVAIPFVNWIANNIADDEGSIQGAKAIAWRMTATALKNSVKEMYQGELTVIGDPSIKPHDKIWIEDIRNRMQGEAEVEAVVHNFSIQTGFTTSIYPDCVCVVDDRYQQLSSVFTKAALAKTGAFYGTLVTTSMCFCNNTRPFITSLAKTLTYGDEGVKVALDGIEKIIGKDDLETYGKFIKGRDKALQKMGVNTSQIHANKFLNKLKGFDKADLLIKEGASIDDIARFYSNLEKTIKDFDAEEVIKTLKSTMENSKDPAAFEKAIEDLKSLNIKSAVEKNLSIDKSAVSAFKDVIEKEDKDALKLLESITKNNKIAPDELKGFSNLIRKYGSKIDPKDLVKATSTISKGAGEAIAEGVGAAAASGEGISEALMVGGAAGGVAGIAGAVAAIIAEMALSYIITACTQQALTRFLKNLEVLQVFPLMKNGKPLIAGLNGSKGAVYGSASYEMQGPLQEWISDLCDDNKHGKFFNFVRDTFVINDDIKGITESWKHNNNFPTEDEAKTAIGRQEIIHDLLKHRAADEMKNLSSIHAMILQPRIQKLNSKEGNDAWRKNAITDIKNIGQNKLITENMVPVCDSSKIKGLKELGYLTLLHDNDSLKKADSKSTHSTPIEFEIGTKKATYNCIYEPNNVIDIPFLKPDSFYLLVEILDRLKKKFEPPTSEVGSKSGFLKHPVVIESCMRVGDKKSWASTGNMFKISVADYPNFLDEICKDNDDLVITKNNDTLIGSTKVNGVYFTAKKTNDCSYMFLVHPSKY